MRQEGKSVFGVPYLTHLLFLKTTHSAKDLINCYIAEMGSGSPQNFLFDLEILRTNIKICVLSTLTIVNSAQLLNKEVPLLS